MQAKVKTPVFIISFDVELAWGFILHRQHTILRMLQNDPLKARGTIDRLLRLLAMYNIPATWAIVGHLLLDSEQGIQSNFQDAPQFKDGWIDWDTYMSIYHQPLYRFEELVEKIITTAQKHEIGLHSFFHLPFSKCSREIAEFEIEHGIKTLEQWGISPKSFVFPGNQIGHLESLKSHGFQIYRGKDATRYDISQNYPMRKFTGVIDKIIAPPVSPYWNNGIWEIPGSILFYDSQMPFTLLPRTSLGLKRTIRTNGVFHIWLHPWNLLLYDSLEQDLASLLKIVAEYRDKGSLQTWTMGQLAECLNNQGLTNIIQC